jgi:endoglucanase
LCITVSQKWVDRFLPLNVNSSEYLGEFMKALLEKLCQTVGPAGYEHQVRELIRSELIGAVDDIRVDALGNLIARKGQKNPKGKRIMLAAHMDEVGILATHIDKNGFVRFASNGGVAVRNCIGTRVIFLDGTRGVISGDKLDSDSKLHTIEQLFIDVGATSPKDCPVKVGDTAIFERPYMELGNRLVSKALDDRCGCALLIKLAHAIKKTSHEIVFAFTVQEEVGFRGSQPAAFGIDPDLGIAVDVTTTGDVPKSRMAVALGKGPAIKIRDAGMLSSPTVVEWMIQTAEKNKIPYQREVLELPATTDARNIQVTRAGVPTGCISIPCRYVHSPSEMIDLSDLENALKLLLKLVENPLL